MDEQHSASADRLRATVRRDVVTPAAFRAALDGVPLLERDAWFDRVLGLDPGAVVDDGPELPRGCVPYLPSPVDALARLVDAASIDASDVFVDVGSGVGRAAAFVRMASGASVIGLEVQGALVREARALVERLGLSRVTFIEGDAAAMRAPGRGDVHLIRTGTVFFFYCPFSGERVERALDDLEVVASTREIRVASLDLPLPARRWLVPVSPLDTDLAIRRSLPR